jgi:MFS family permease
LTAHAKKLLSYLIKLGILVLAFWFIYQRIGKYHDSLHNFSTLVARIPVTRVFLVIGSVLALMLVNWVLEALKWQYLSHKLAALTVWQSIESVFCGLTWAIFTPNRFGEYGGRVMYLPRRRRIYGVFAMAVGSFGQNVVTNVLGGVGLAWFLCTYIFKSHWLIAGSILCNLGLIAVMLIIYFNIRWFVGLLDRIKFLKKYRRFFDIMGEYTFNELMRIMGFCMARFFVFTFQYFLIIHLLIPQLGVVPMMLMMFVFFFIQSAMPSQDIIDFGVRNFTASMLFAYITHQQIAIVVAVSLIYIVNIIIPAILGSVFVLNLKFFDRTA